MMTRLLGFTALLSAGVVAAQPVVPGVSSTHWRVGMAETLTTGSGPHQLGVTMGVKEQRPRAANAIAIEGKNVWVVDGENSRMLKLGGATAAKPTFTPLVGARGIVDLVPMAKGLVGYSKASSKLLHIDQHGAARDLGGERVESFSSLVPTEGRSVLLKSGRKLIKVDVADDEPPPAPAPSPPGLVAPSIPMRIQSQAR